MLSPWNCLLAASFLAIGMAPTLSAKDPGLATPHSAEVPKGTPVPPAIAAAREAKRPEQVAMIDRSKVDPDFAFQGEFHGTVYTDIERRAGMVLALQVIARGAGRFDAVVYPGGFPGQGYPGWGSDKLTGTRIGSVVDLHGSMYRIIVTDRYADIYLHDGWPAGQIAKIHRVSSTEDALPPWGALVLYNGFDVEQFVNGRISRDGYLMEGTYLKPVFSDYTLHVEFMLPYMPYARGQGRGNSGVYLQSRYEVQILDSFGLEGKDNECGGLYKLRRPDANMCFPPLSWQTYDIVFTSPRFSPDGTKTENARATVYHNGVAVHNNVDVERKTGGGAQEGPELLPIRLQEHGNPVRFRNIWIVDDSRPTGSPYPPYARYWAPYTPWFVGYYAEVNRKRPFNLGHSH